MTVTVAGTGIFTTAALNNAGATTVTITQLTSGIFAGGIGANNTSSITINSVPTTSFTKNDLSCFQNSTGQIVITCSGGTAPYTYSIDNGTNYSSPVPTGTFNNLSAGTYKIRVKDNNGCESKPVQ